MINDISIYFRENTNKEISIHENSKVIDIDIKSNISDDISSSDSSIDLDKFNLLSNHNGSVPSPNQYSKNNDQQRSISTKAEINENRKEAFKEQKSSKFTICTSSSTSFPKTEISKFSQIQNSKNKSNITNDQNMIRNPNIPYYIGQTQPLYYPTPTFFYKPFYGGYPNYNNIYQNQLLHVNFPIQQNYHTLKSLILNQQVNLMEYLSSEVGSMTFMSLFKTLQNEEKPTLLEYFLNKILNFLDVLMSNLNALRCLIAVYPLFTKEQFISFWMKISVNIPKIIEDEQSTLNLNKVILIKIDKIYQAILMELVEPYFSTMSNSFNGCLLIKSILETYDSKAIKAYLLFVYENIYLLSKNENSVEIIIFLIKAKSKLIDKIKFVTCVSSHFPKIQFKSLGSKIITLILEKWGIKECSQIVSYFQQNFIEMLNGINSCVILETIITLALKNDNIVSIL